MSGPAIEAPLACTVRDCLLPLGGGDRAWTCARGHSYDIARSGYVNLLQPQDRRSAQPGDARAAVDARARVLARGIGAAILGQFVDRAAGLAPSPSAVAVDLGSGSGDALAALARARPLIGVGIDLSVAAVEQAARRFPALTWVVANADRRLPILDRSVDLVCSLHARRNPAECRRVLRDSGFLLVGVPAPDDLIELRAAVYGAGLERDRAAAVLAEHHDGFMVVERVTARERHVIEHDILLDLLRGSYRGAREANAVAIGSLDSLAVTLASDFLLLAPRR